MATPRRNASHETGCRAVSRHVDDVVCTYGISIVSTSCRVANSDAVIPIAPPKSRCNAENNWPVPNGSSSGPVRTFTTTVTDDQKVHRDVVGTLGDRRPVQSDVPLGLKRPRAPGFLPQPVCNVQQRVCRHIQQLVPPLGERLVQGALPRGDSFQTLSADGRLRATPHPCRRCPVATVAALPLSAGLAPNMARFAGGEVCLLHLFEVQLHHLLVRQPDTSGAPSPRLSACAVIETCPH